MKPKDIFLAKLRRRAAPRVGIGIIGPECAVPLDAPYENLRTIVEVARKLGGE